MKYLLLLAALLPASVLFAQEEGEMWKPASKESEAYHEYRLKETMPPYGLAKIKAMIAKVPFEEGELHKLSNKDYMALTLREKFTYHMIHGENFSQNCDPSPPIQDEQKKIFGVLPDIFYEYSWSERQTNFLQSNRDSVMALIKESVNRSKRMGSNYKKAILAINGKEMIPFLIATYNIDKKDHDILTLLMLLMKTNEYAPFMSSPSFRKLYGQDFNYKAYLDFNTANEELILKRASDFYAGTR
ncbi:hypothetical protein [Chitinophaga nivalis]|uniref:DUF4919 domain-containing protein n=1 Tax=Chitinophaga nivalis TaxID=2991709 RepID=A0ABT3IER8_9BACT|nr:hypothetical protein [Chitinophaga nivalis]MCW3467858.1 hypothetical protein [Chitinophaga nivalis]MCW3482450.1 hypothetical protein [Chitinophaga nivalis]